MITARKVVTIYAELTPNPNSIKFVANQNLLTNGTVEYLKKEDAIDCPLAYQLFDFSGVKKVFITSNFITISKENDLKSSGPFLLTSWPKCATVKITLEPVTA